MNSNLTLESRSFDLYAAVKSKSFYPEKRKKNAECVMYLENAAIYGRVAVRSILRQYKNLH